MAMNMNTVMAVKVRGALRLVEDLLPGVVADPGGLVAERPHRQVQLGGAEGGAVDEVRPVPGVLAGGGDLLDGAHARFRVGETEVPQVDVGLDRLELDREGE